jgi:hypothetical protein
MEEIIWNADTYHFGALEFFITDKLVKQEIKARTGILFAEWKNHSLHLLKTHQYYTGYCRQRPDEEKINNIILLEAYL